jgi:hypothetical protein
MTFDEERIQEERINTLRAEVKRHGGGELLDNLPPNLSADAEERFLRNVIRYHEQEPRARRVFENGTKETDRIRQLAQPSGPPQISLRKRCFLSVITLASLRLLNSRASSLSLGQYESTSNEPYLRTIRSGRLLAHGIPLYMKRT